MGRFLAIVLSIIITTSCTPMSVPVAELAVSSSSTSISKVLNVMSSSAMPSTTNTHCYPGSCGISAMTDEELQKVLTPDQHYVMRKAGTERPYTSPLNDEHRAGTFVAADTGEPLFRSETKFDSGTGWPSFSAPISDSVLIKKTDTILGYARTEVLTRNNSHLGHVFSDGPKPTGLRYCINGLALRFIPDAN